jgi:tetratricopeptide (TPR) repeat protein
MRAGLAQEYAVDATRREQIVAAAAGNPAFARMLAGVEMLPGDPTAGGPDSTLPRQLRATLAVMLEERLDRADDRDALQELLLHLALLGGESSAQLLAAFVDADASAFADAVDALVELQLVSEPAIDRLRLTYPMMRELLLDQAPPRRLRRLHLRAAELRRETEGDVGEVGDHLFAAGNESAAVEHWLRAQKTAFDFGDCRQAAQWGQKAIAHLSSDRHAHFETSVLLARALREMTAYEDAVRVLVPLVEQEGASPERFRAAELLGEVLQEQGDDEAWARCVARVEADLPPEPGLARRAALRMLSFWSNHRLEVAKAQRYAEEALVGEDLGVDERATAYKRLFWALFYQVEFDRAMSVARRLLSLGEETGRADIEAEGFRLVGKIHQETPAFDESIAAFERSLALYRRSGRQSRIINVYLDIMFVACTANRWDEARAYVERFQRVRSTAVLDYTGVLVRMTELRCRALGRHERVADALAALDAHVHSTSFGFRDVVRGEWLSALVREGRPDDARPMLADFFESVKSLPPLVWIATQLEHLAEALGASDDAWRRASAVTSLELAAMVYRRLGNAERAKSADAKRASF